MATKDTAAESFRDEILARNTKINRETVAAYRRLERKLKKLGVEIKPSFNLEPPLGRNRTGFHNRSG